MNGVHPKTRETVHEAYPAFADSPPGATARGEANRDRVLITLLALNFLLMAFFAVMTSIAGETRTTIVAPAGRAEPSAEASASTAAATQARLLEEERRRAVDLLRASVAQVFAPVIAADETWRARTVERVGPDRVDIEVPFALFASPDHVAEGDMILAGIAGVVGAGVRGYRTDLALRASHPETDVALLAGRLIAHGLAPGSLSVGILKPAGGQTSGEAMLRFSFLLLEDGGDVVARLAGVPR